MGKDFIGHERSCIYAIGPCQPIDVAGETFDQCCSHADRREVVELAPRRHFQAGNRKGNCHPWPVSRPLDSAHAGFLASSLSLMPTGSLPGNRSPGARSPDFDEEPGCVGESVSTRLSDGAVCLMASLTSSERSASSGSQKSFSPSRIASRARSTFSLGSAVFLRWEAVTVSDCSERASRRA